MRSFRPHLPLLPPPPLACLAGVVLRRVRADERHALGRIPQRRAVLLEEAPPLEAVRDERDVRGRAAGGPDEEQQREEQVLEGVRGARLEQDAAVGGRRGGEVRMAAGEILRPYSAAMPEREAEWLERRRMLRRLGHT